MNTAPASAPLSLGILAGGEGRRFGGADKGWMMFKGRPLAVRLAEQLVPLGDELLISANRNLPRYGALGARVIRDTAGAGPLAGIAALAAAAAHRWLFCVPVDCVHPPLDWLKAARAAAWAGQADIAALHDGQRAHPTFCLLDTRLAADADAELRAGRYGLQTWMQRHRLLWLNGPEPLNCNTPEQLAELENA